MKLIDYIIVAAVIGVFYLAYAGHRTAAVFVGAAIITVAGWRFWDRSRAKHFGASDENLPDKDDATSGTDDHPGNDGGGSADGGGDAGGGD